MVIRLAYLKLVRPNRSTFSPGSAITTTIQGGNLSIAPLGAAGTTAASTIVTNEDSKYQYYLNKAYSAVHAALTAVTSGSDQINII